jgi:tetratricopeptide (TPR) repeat protein
MGKSTSVVEDFMSVSRLIKACGLAVVMTAFAGIVPAHGQTGGLTGKANLQNGSLCVGCPIIIERQEIKGTYKTKTDKKGKYTYIGLPVGTYKITLQNPNGRTLFYFGGQHIGLGEPTELNFDLAKEIKTQQQANPEAQQKIEQQAKEQKEYQGLKGLFDAGVALMNEKKYAEAAAKFEQALPLAKGKNELAVEERLAEAYTKDKQYDKAAEIYKKSIELDPTNAGLHNNLGNVYADMNKIPDAKAEFQKSAEVDPAHAGQAYFNLGAIMYNQGNMDESAAAFKKATEIDEKYAAAYFWLGQALMGKATMNKEGKVIPAPGTIEALETYLKLEPNGTDAETAKALLQTVQGEIPTEFSKKKKKG